MGKGSFILYDTDLESVEFLNENQRGRLFSALLNYRLHSEQPDLNDDVAVKILFHQMRDHIAINEKKYKEICEKRSEASKKRWSAENDSKIQMNANEYKCTEKNANVYLNDNENDNDIVNDIENDNENVACGAQKKTKERKNYYNKKNNVPLLLRDEPSYDISAFTKKSLEKLRGEKTPKETKSESAL